MIIVPSRWIDALKIIRCSVVGPGSTYTAIAMAGRGCVGVRGTGVLPRETGSNEDFFKVDGEIVGACQEERREDSWETLVESVGVFVYIVIESYS
jgi:hypothetical protein